MGRRVETETLRQPRGFFQATIRRLAEKAVGDLYHDISPDMPEHIHAVQNLERAFTNILRGKLRSPAPVTQKEKAE